MYRIGFKLYFFVALFGFLFLPAQAVYTSKLIDSLLASRKVNEERDLKSNIDFYDKLYKESEKLRDERNMYRSLLGITAEYMIRGQYKNAIPYFTRIENLPVKNPENYKYKGMALYDKVNAFTNLGLYQEAQAAIDQMLVVGNRLKGDSKYEIKGKGYDVKAALYIEMKKPEDSVLFYLKKTVYQYKNIKNSQLKNKKLQAAYINISTSFFEAKKPDSALYYSYKARSVNKDINIDADAYLSQTIGRVHFQRNHLDSALYYYKRAEQKSEKLKDPNALKVIYQDLSGIYEKRNNKDSALLYNKKYAHLADSLIVINKQGAEAASQVIKAENEKRRVRLYWVAGSIIVLFMILALYFLKNYNKEKKAKLEKKEIIEEKDKELKTLKTKVNDSFEEVVFLAKNNDPAFLNRFKEVYPEFCNAMLRLYPDIINSELAFCAYLKLNFSTKDIATYTFVTPKAVQNRKNRIRKKLNIPSDEDIYLWMGRIDQK